MKVLLFTLSEYGQANTILALAEELATREDVDVHVCSHVPLKTRVEAIPTPASSSAVSFHLLKGPTFLESAVGLEGIQHPPSSKSSQAFHGFDLMLSAYDDETYYDFVQQCKVVLKTLDPDLIIIDIACAFAVDACRLLDRRYIINSPTQTMDVMRLQQPWLKGLWYYPAPFSGIPFPVPWGYFLSNITISLQMISFFLSNSRIRDLPLSRKACGLKGGHPFFEIYHADIDIICPSIEETDYPCVCPPNVHRFGTITADAIPLHQSDPDMKAWLDRRKTVVIALGTHTIYTEEMVRAFLRGLLDVLPPDMQVLWKLQRKKLFSDVIDEMLGAVAKDDDRFRIVDWIIANPKAIMEHPNVVCYVHHGGANSFFECCLTGVPQIIMAMWFDLYDNAVKAEYRGIGIYGNRSCAPSVDPVEFGQALARVISPGLEGIKLKENALRVAELCKRAGGKKAAVDLILSTAARGKVRVYAG